MMTTLNMYPANNHGPGHSSKLFESPVYAREAPYFQTDIENCDNPLNPGKTFYIHHH